MENETKWPNPDKAGLLKCLLTTANYYKELGTNVMRFTLTNALNDLKQQLLKVNASKLFITAINEESKKLQKKEVLTWKEAYMFCLGLHERINNIPDDAPEPETKQYEPVNSHIIDKIVEKVAEIEASIEQIKLIVQQIKSV